jgi:hypothetical protein
MQCSVTAFEMHAKTPELDKLASWHSGTISLLVQFPADEK